MTPRVASCEAGGGSSRFGPARSRSQARGSFSPVLKEVRMKRTIPALALVSLIFFSFVLLFAQNQGSSLNINVRDYCDPTTFNASIGPCTCVRDTTNASITFPALTASLRTDKSVDASRFSPGHAKVEDRA